MCPSINGQVLSATLFYFIFSNATFMEGIYEYEEAILDAADITSEFNSLAVSRASRANKMEGVPRLRLL